jgi:hypothetical protein
LLLYISRYKVQTSIAQKQRDSQLKSSPQINYPLSTRSGLHADKPDSDSAKTLQLSLEQDVNKWKTAYEAAVAENEHLRSRSEEADIVLQWRHRYEICERERDEALNRLRSILEPSAEPSKRILPSTSLESLSVFNVDDDATGNGTGTSYTAMLKNDVLSPAAIYQKYIALREEYEVGFCGLYAITMFSSLFQFRYVKM